MTLGLKGLLSWFFRYSFSFNSFSWVYSKYYLIKDKQHMQPDTSDIQVLLPICLHWCFKGTSSLKFNNPRLSQKTALHKIPDGLDYRPKTIICFIHERIWNTWPPAKPFTHNKLKGTPAPYPSPLLPMSLNSTLPSVRHAWYLRRLFGYHTYSKYLVRNS